MSEFFPKATKFAELREPIALRRGGVLTNARIAFEDWGRPTPARDNVIVILPGLSPSAHAAANADDPSAGWWEGMIGPGKPIDTDRWYVVCLNPLGSCHGSTGPASLNPLTGSTYGLDFPDITIEDVADAGAMAVRALGIRDVSCLIGNSMGGMAALALLARHPDLVRNHISVSSAVHALPFSIAVRSMQREAIRLDPRWNGGDYDDLHYPEHGMERARKLGIVTYRSAIEWDARFARRRAAGGDRDRAERFGPEYEIEDYLARQARRFARSYDPNCYLYLSRCMDWFDLGETLGCTPDAALSRLNLDGALILGVESDILFPVHQQQQIADGLRAGGVETAFLSLASPQGHDAFLVDLARFGPPIGAFLASLTPRAAPRRAGRPALGALRDVSRPPCRAPSPPGSPPGRSPSARGWAPADGRARAATARGPRGLRGPIEPESEP